MPTFVDFPPPLRHPGPVTLTAAPEPSPVAPPALRSVAVVVDEGLSPFEMAVACEVFGLDRTDDGIPSSEFTICAPAPGSYATLTGFSVTTEHGFDDLAAADLIVVPGLGIHYLPSPELVTQLRAAIERGAHVMSLCNGAFVLARAGLLDGRQATTHWRYAEQFTEWFPQVELVADVLYVQDGPIMTSAGTAAGIDLCLHLVRQVHGPAAANQLARRMVVPPQRPGGQAQYTQTPVREVDAPTLAPVLDWAQAHLDDDLSVQVLARRAAMSERTFARRFRDETGVTPHQWVLGQRVALAEELLERGDLSIEQIAQACGFGSGTMLRHHFHRVRGVTPTSYRRAFGPEPVATRSIS